MATWKLKAVKFQKEHIALVQDFRCGSLPHESPLADWIKKQVLEALKYSKAKIWLYFTDDTKPLDPNNLVGYGSINSDEIFGEGEDGKRVAIKVLTIPTLALNEPFWGKPKTDDPEDKYSRQIVRHLQDEARGWLSRSANPPEPWLFLIVHRDATPAQKLYADCGFVRLPMTYHDKRTGVNCPRMVCRLR